MSFDYTKLCGWHNDPVAVAAVQKAQPFKVFSAASSQFNTAGYGAGKRVLLYEYKYKAVGGKKNVRTRRQGIGDCVSQGAAEAGDILKSILCVNEGQEWIAEMATEPIYALSRVEIGRGRLGSGDGSVGAWAAEACKRYGTLIRIKYGKYDLTEYSAARAHQWGMPNAGLPDDLEPVAREHLIKTVTLVTTWSEFCDSIASGYPVTVASSQGFTKTRDSQGFAKPWGTWQHQMCFTASDDLSSRKGGLCQNSWGADYFSGPIAYDQPDGSFWVDKSIVESMLAAGDSWAYSDYVGFPPKKLNLGIMI